jgi:hypothetical protein
MTASSKPPNCMSMHVLAAHPERANSVAASRRDQRSLDRAFAAAG